MKEYILKKRINVGKTVHVIQCEADQKIIKAAATKVLVFDKNLNVLRVEWYCSKCAEKKYPDVAGWSFRKHKDKKR